jgi:hypothetical protein
MFNDKQIELGDMLFERLKKKFPEIEMTGITESAENPSYLWVRIVLPEDEDREFALRDVASEISTDILLDYGYHISIFPAERGQLVAA